MRKRWDKHEVLDLYPLEVTWSDIWGLGTVVPEVNTLNQASH